MLRSITLLGLGLATNCDLVESAKAKTSTTRKRSNLHQVERPNLFHQFLGFYGAHQYRIQFD